MPRASTPAGNRLRCRRACDSCKRRKQKCNGEQPCTICVQRHKEAECHFSDKPARLLQPNGTKETILLSEQTAASPQRQTAMDHLLNSLEDRSASMELEQQKRREDQRRQRHPQERHQQRHQHQQQVSREDKDGTAAPVPKVARLLRDGQGKFMYIGDSASLSFLQSVRRIVAAAIGQCEFTEDSSRHSMLEAFQSNPSVQAGPLETPPENDEAQRLAGQYVLATSPLLDLFDLQELHPRLANWVQNPRGDEDTVSSIFYLVLAIGAQVSNTNQTVPEQYFVSGRQLAFSAFTETPSLYTIQSYVLISMYMLGACRRNGAFMNLGIALRAAYAVGIHRKDANALFCGRERRARERVWKSLRMMDLFLSASLGRPPATSDIDHELREDALPSDEQQLPASDQLSVAVITLSRIFERILTDVYMKQVISIQVAETISNQHRAWVRSLPSFLRIQTERLDSKTLEGSLAAAHVFGSYYWSIILLTRPFLTYRVSQYVKSRGGPSDTRVNNSRIVLFADACVYSALRGLHIVDDLAKFTSLPLRLPFLINSVFNSAIVLGAAFFADYDNLLPLEEGMNKAEKFLELFVPHDPHAYRFFQIIRYLHAAVREYTSRRSRQWMERRSRQVDQLFGQVVPDDTSEPTSPTPAATAAAPSPSLQPVSQPQPQTHDLTPHPDDVWDSLYTNDLPYDPAAISALTTTGIPLGSPALLGSGLTPPAPAPAPVHTHTPVPAHTPTTETALDPNTHSDILFPPNGLLYMAEDLPMFGIWEET